MNAQQRDTWRNLYREALFEVDPERLSTRIAQAREAICWRRVQLWESGEAEVPERSELDAASYFLGLLHSIAVGGEGLRMVSVASRKRVS